MELSQVIGQLQQHPEMIERLASSADGQKLMQRLDPTLLQQATQQGQSGSYQEMAELLRGIMKDAEGKALLQRMAKQLRL